MVGPHLGVQDLEFGMDLGLRSEGLGFMQAWGIVARSKEEVPYRELGGGSRLSHSHPSCL